MNRYDSYRDYVKAMFKDEDEYQDFLMWRDSIENPQDYPDYLGEYDNEVIDTARYSEECGRCMIDGMDIEDI